MTTVDESVFDQLARRYDDMCPPGYDLQENVNSFYSGDEFWQVFSDWEQTEDSYSIRDKAFMERCLFVDGKRIVNIGCYVPWAELEWGERAGQWLAVDINRTVLDRAADYLGSKYANHVQFEQQDITKPVVVKKPYDCLVDFSTFDQLNPRCYRQVLENYARYSPQLVMAYDATESDIVDFDFEAYGFNACINPDVMVAMLEAGNYRLLEHQSFAYGTRSYIHARQR